MGARASLGTVLLGVGLSVASPTSAEILTVGPAGAFATVQEAIWNGAVHAGSNEIRIQEGLYAENLGLPSPPGGCCEGRLDISGGWDDRFSRRRRDPSLTVIDGRGMDRVFSIILSRNSLSIQNMTLRGGHRGPSPALIGVFGAGLDALIRFPGVLLLRDLVLSGNRLSADDSSLVAHGAGAFIHAVGDARVRVERCRFEGNLTDGSGATSLAAIGAGLAVTAQDRAQVEVLESRFERNAAWSTGLARGAGLGVTVDGPDARVAVEDGRFVDNLLFGTPEPDSAAGAWLHAANSVGSPQVVFRRN